MKDLNAQRERRQSCVKNRKVNLSKKSFINIEKVEKMLQKMLSTVNTTDTLETLRVQYNNLNSDVVTLDNTVSGGGTSVAADNISTGDAAVSIATTSGNITIDAQQVMQIFFSKELMIRLT